MLSTSNKNIISLSKLGSKDEKASLPTFNDSVTKKQIVKSNETLSKQTARYALVDQNVDYEKTRASNTQPEQEQSQTILAENQSIPTKVMAMLRAPSKNPHSQNQSLTDEFDNELRKADLLSQQTTKVEQKNDLFGSDNNSSLPSQLSKSKSSQHSSSFLRDSQSSSGPNIMSSKYSSTKSSTSARSVNSFKSYRTDDTNASCLFVTQLVRKLCGTRRCARSVNQYEDENAMLTKINDAVVEQSKKQAGPKPSRQGRRIGTTNDLIQSIDEHKLKVLLNTSLSYKQFCLENGLDQFTCDP